MSLLTSPVLIQLYKEIHAHDIEYKSDAFWTAYLALQFPQERGYTVSPQWAPTDDSRDRCDAAVRALRGPEGNQFFATLLFLETKRPGKGPKGAEEQLMSAGTQYLNKETQESFVYGMTAWGSKARCWMFRREGGRYQLLPLFGSGELGKKREYVDAHSEAAYFITASMSYIRGESVDWPGSVFESVDQEGSETAVRASGAS